MVEVEFGSFNPEAHDLIAVHLDARGGKRVEFSAEEFKDFRHGYYA